MKLLRFFALTFLLTWTCWIAASALPANALPAQLLFFLGVIAPSLVALALTLRDSGRDGVLTLLRRLVQWRLPARWYVFAISYLAVIKLTAAVIHRVAVGSWPQFGDTAWYILLAGTFFSTIVLGQAGEEIGWRGYALPRLADRVGFGGAAVLLGIIWALWHLPLFVFFPAGQTYGQSFPIYLLNVTALSVAMTWLYVHTNGSLLTAMLMHAAINNTKDIVPGVAFSPGSILIVRTSVQGWLTLALLWILATYFLVRMRSKPWMQAARTGAVPHRSSASTIYEQV